MHAHVNKVQQTGVGRDGGVNPVHSCLYFLPSEITVMTAKGEITLGCLAQGVSSQLVSLVGARLGEISSGSFQQLAVL